MSGISGVSGISSGTGSYPISPMPTTATGQQASTSTGAVDTFSQSSMMSSSASIMASSESLSISQSPVLADKQLMGLVVLLLTLEYMQSDDEEEKEGLLSLMTLMASQQSSEEMSMNYSSTSLSINTSQVQAMSSDISSNAGGYGGLESGASGGQIDVTA